MSIELTDAQFGMMRAAAERDDRCLSPSPALKGGAARKVAAKLVAANLAREIKARGDMPVWPRDLEGGQSFALKLTAAGLKIIATRKEPAAAIESEGPASPDAATSSMSSVDATAGSKHANDAAPRSGTKLAEVVGLLRRSGGAAIGELTAATGWLPHTTRAAITGLRKRGYSVIRERAEDGGSVYRISHEPAEEVDDISSPPETKLARRRREPMVETRVA